MEVARFLRDAEGRVVQMTEGYLTHRRDRLRVGDGASAFVVVHALRGVLVAAAARDPGLLRAAPFREALAGMLERFLLR
jgi:hypothetical protein